MSDCLSCFGCKYEPQISEIARFSSVTREIIDSFMPLVIDAAMEVVIESDREKASPVIDQKVSGIIDLVAESSAVANSVDTELLSEIEACLNSGECDEEARTESLTGCPKLDILFPKMAELASRLELP